jgi:hypothetical protein
VLVGRVCRVLHAHQHHTARVCIADLPHAAAGLLGFPPKALHYRFLSTFRPVFYIRTRNYSKVTHQSGKSQRLSLP